MAGVPVVIDSMVPFFDFFLKMNQIVIAGKHPESGAVLSEMICCIKENCTHFSYCCMKSLRPVRSLRFPCKRKEILYTPCK